MFLVTKINDQITTYNLDELAEKYSGIINIGQHTKYVWNTIAIGDESIDQFQCHLIGCVGGPWTLNHGQQRTECPKGLLSSKTIPCNGCTGRCVNVTPGRPKYPKRIPETPTLINNKPVSEWGTTINPGDEISFGNVTLLVR